MNESLLIKAEDASSSISFEAMGSVEWVRAEGENDPERMPSFSLVAYTGGPMNVGFYAPVIVDLSGFTTDQVVPILRDHLTSQVVGHSEHVNVQGNQILVDGALSAANDHSAEIVNSAKNSFPWKASIGASIDVREYVEAGKSVKVNGKQWQGPLIVARKSTLREVSFVAIPADSKSKAKVAASANQENSDMNFNEWLVAKGFDPDSISDSQRTSLQAMFDAEESGGGQEPPAVEAAGGAVATLPDPNETIQAHRQAVAQEETRIARVREVCAGNHPDIQASAIGEGWSGEATELAVLRAERPASGQFAIHASSGDLNPQQMGQVLEAAACQAVGVNTENRYSEEVVEAADQRFRGRIGLQELIMEAAWANGFTGRSFNANQNAAFQAAFSTVSLPGILSNIANKSLLDSFMSVEDTWRKIAHIDRVSDFKERKSYRLTAGMVFEEVGPSGELKHGDVEEGEFSNRAKTYGKMFSLTREHIINDDLGALTRIPSQIGRGAALKLNEVFWAVFLANSGFFSAGNKNYFDGASSALGIDSLTTAEQLFRDQTDSKGNPIAIDPLVLLVPNALSATAETLMLSREIRDNTANKKTTTGNPHAGKFEVVRSSYLSSSKFGALASSLAWHLLANPADLATIEVVFLNGQQTPTVESADAQFNVLGVDFRGFFDFGVSLHEHRAGVKAKGEA